MHIAPVLLLVCVCLQLAASKQTLDILGMYPKDGDGWTEPFVEYSADVALRHIQLNGSILRDYQLRIDWKNTQCNSGIALKEFVDALGTNQSKTYLAVFGGGCAVATSQVAALSYRYGLAQIAYASTAPNLGNRKLYPRFVRGVPSDINAVPARASFIKLHNWRRVAIINEQDPIFVASSHYMESVLDRLQVEYRVEDFAPSGTLPLDQQVRTIAENLRTNGYRIIIANMYEDAAIMLFCKLYQQKETLLLPNISTWIFLGWFTDQWHNKPAVLAKVGCTAEEVASVSNGALGFLVAHSKQSFRGENNTQITIANLTPAQIYKEYKSYVLEKLNNNTSQFDEESDQHDAYVYDSLWTLALSLQGMLDSGTNLTAIAEKQIFRDTEVFTENSGFSSGLYEGMLRQRFEGWAGLVEYIGHERFYDRVQLLEFVWGDLLYRGEFENIPHSNYTEEAIGNIKLVPDEIKFLYWNPQTASDGIISRPTPESILSVGAVITVAIAIYITFLIAMIMAGKFQGLQSIQNSSPILTCVILGGNYLLLLAGVLYLASDRIVGHNNGNFLSNVSGEEATTEVCDAPECKLLCMLPVSLLLVSSSLVFGGMIGKATLIYVCAVQLNFSLSDKMKMVLRFVWLALFSCVDILFVLVWSLVSSLVMKSEVLPTGGDDPPFIRVIQCRPPHQHEVANNVLVGLLIVYKSGIILIGLVMAYNLRNVKRNSLRYWGTITWTMYNTSIFSLVLILSFFLITDFVIKQIIVAVLILLTVFITVSITGLPPVYYRFKDPNLTRESAKSVGNTGKIVKNKTMWEHEVTALQNDRRELKSEIQDLKSENIEMVRKMTLSDLNIGTSFERIEEKPGPVASDDGFI